MHQEAEEANAHAGDQELLLLGEPFCPYFMLIKAKQGDEEDQARAAEAFTKWINGDNPENLEKLCHEGFALEERLREAASKQRAFENKGEEQVRFVNAADYADGWVDDGAGNQFNVYYICQSDQGAGWPSATPSLEARHGIDSMRTPMPLGSDGTAATAAPSTKRSSAS